jgi:lipopolysaccharide export system ATP-binding protein
MAILEVKGLEKVIGTKQIVKGLDLEVNPSEVVGLLGPNGAGKTTTFYMIMGLVQQNKGSIWFKGEMISNDPVHKRAQKGIGYLGQEPSVFQDLTVEQNILLVLENEPLDKKQMKERLEDHLDEFHLKKLRNQLAGTLSGGERRRLEITRTLIKKPQLLLLDEPFANVDPITIQEMKKQIKILSKRGIAILITDHNAREIFSICDRIYLIQEGAASFNGTAQELLENVQARQTYLGSEFTL